VRVVVAPEARDDLAAAVGYIAKDNPAAAARLLNRVREVIALLAEGRSSSRLRPIAAIRLHEYVISDIEA
jgi:plasmid stabilization system protein ParE